MNKSALLSSETYFMVQSHDPNSGNKRMHTLTKIIVVKKDVLENLGAQQLGSIACITGPNRYRKVEDA